MGSFREGADMAGKKHRGLGRGLDALIPMAKEKSEDSSSARPEESPEASGTAESGSANREQTNSDAGKRAAGSPRSAAASAKPVEAADKPASEEHGLIEPLTVQDNGTHYSIINGERRWRACKIAGIREVPVIIKNYDDTQKVVISLIDNLQREDLNPIEEAEAYQRLIDEFQLRQEEVAQKVSKNRSTITNALRLLKLSEDVRDMVAQGVLSMGQARALLPVTDPQQQKALADRIVAENLSVREVERLVKNLGKSKPQKKPDDPALEAIYQDIETRLNQSLGMKVAISHKNKNGGKLEIQFTSNDDLEKSDFFDSIGLGFLDPGILILVLFALFIVVLILVITDISGRKKLERRLDQLTSGTDGESLEDTMLKIFREYAGLHKVLDRNTQDIDDIYDRLQTVIQKVGLNTMRSERWEGR